MLTYPCWDQSWSMLVTGPLLSFWQLSMQLVMKFSPKWPHFRFSVHYRTVMICLAEQTQTTSKQWNKNSTPSDKHYQQSAVRYNGVTGVHLICIVWMRPYAYKLVCICISWSRIAISLTDDDLSRHLFAFFAFTIQQWLNLSSPFIGVINESRTFHTMLPERVTHDFVPWKQYPLLLKGGLAYHCNRTRLYWTHKGGGMKKKSEKSWMQQVLPGKISDIVCIIQQKISLRHKELLSGSRFFLRLCTTMSLSHTTDWFIILFHPFLHLLYLNLLFQITFMFDRCHYSADAVTPLKYEWDSKYFDPWASSEMFI